MRLDVKPSTEVTFVAEDYWALPEIALMLRVVIYLCVGAILAVCLGFLLAPRAGTVIEPGLVRGAVSPVRVCPCELKLTPIPQGRRQWAQQRESRQS